MKSRNNFTYYLREGVHGVGVHRFMSFAAVCIIVACMLIMGIFVMLLINVNAMLDRYEQDSEILVYIDENYTTAEARSVGSKINRVDNILRADFVTREQALESFKAKYADSNTFDGIEADTFRDRYQVYLEDLSRLQETENALRAIDGVAEVTAHQELADGFATIRAILAWVSGIVIGILVIVSLFIISNTIKMALLSRREEIGIMRMVGATNWFIRWPFVIEGMILGLLGAVASFFLQWLLYNLVCSRIAAMDSLRILSTVPFGDMAWFVGATCLLGGLLIGVLGSLLSIRRFLKV